MLINSIRLDRIAPWIDRLILLAAVAVCVRILLPVLGITRPFFRKLPDLAAPELLGPLGLHALYGVLLFALVVGCGGAVLAVIGTRLLLRDSDNLVFAVPAGLVVVVLVSIAHAFSFIGGTVALAGLVFLAAIGLVCLWPSLRFGRLVSWRSLLIVLLALAYGAFVGLSLRPATSQWIGTVDVGDLTIYTGWYHTFRRGLVPFTNLGVEGEHIITYFNQAPAFIALLLDDLPTFDASLYFTTILITFFVTALSFALRGVSISRPAESPLTLTSLALAVALVTAANGRPSWIVESPPAALLFPLVPAVAYAVHQSGSSLVKLIWTVLLTGAISVGSKVVSLVVLGGYAALTLVDRLRGHVTKRQAIGLAIVAALLAVYVVAMLWKFGGLFLANWDPGPETLDRAEIYGWSPFSDVFPEVARDLAMLPLIVGAYFVGGFALAGAVAIGEITLLYHWQLFSRTGQITAYMLVALVLILTGPVDRRAIPWILATILLSLPFSFLRDPGEWAAMAAWALVMIPMLWLAFVAAPPKTTTGPHLDRSLRVFATGVLIVSVVALPAIAIGKFRVGSRYRTITPVALAELWEQTRALTPPQALVFTDQTGDEQSRLSGWNDFALQSERQFFLSTWVSSRLRLDPEARRRQLAINDAVLSGTCRPEDVPLSRGYDGYYAATANTRNVPAAFVPVFRNDAYTLYRIPTGMDGGNPAACAGIIGGSEPTSER